MHPPVRLALARRRRAHLIVIITRDLDPEAVTRLFDAFLERRAPDTPDRAALFDNPLVPLRCRSLTLGEPGAGSCHQRLAA
jgi:hypothetical protein